VREFLLQLSIAQREWIELLFIQGYTQAEVARIKNMPLGTIKSKSRAALIQLRSLASNSQTTEAQFHLSA
jgi:RNA polymerase sigma-70 factor (ECF subfamily)